MAFARMLKGVSMMLTIGKPIFGGVYLFQLSLDQYL